MSVTHTWHGSMQANRMPRRHAQGPLTAMYFMRTVEPEGRVVIQGRLVVVRAHLRFMLRTYQKVYAFNNTPPTCLRCAFFSLLMR